MANPEHLIKINQGVEAWNAWRETNRSVMPDLMGAELLGANSIEGADLSAFVHATFAKANVVKHVFTAYRIDPGQRSKGANLNGADLRGVNLREANLLWADLVEADLRGADLTQAKLYGANFTRADLTEANLQHAFLGDTIFGSVDLSAVKNLETAVHARPSSIGIDTIYRSRGAISEEFLRGCGVPEPFVVYARSLLANPVDYFSCFISYSTIDQAFADRLYTDLQANGVRCWFAPHDIAGGRKIHEQIDEAIRLHDKLLLILSPSSINSKWVQLELTKARKREVRDNARLLFPIGLASYEMLKNWECFDADTVTDLAAEVRGYFIPDFSEWRVEDTYKKAFDRLLRDLESTDRGGSIAITS